jgi:membrane protease subunit HflC
VNREAQGFGVIVADVRIRRADLPEANSQAVFQRMQTERQREAAQFRAQGGEQAQRIRAEADREVARITGEANGSSEEVRGSADAERNRIFADAYSRDPEFFRFFRSIQAYTDSLKPSLSRFLLSPDSEFFRYFRDPSPPGARSGPAAASPAAAPTPAPAAPVPQQ